MPYIHAQMNIPLTIETEQELTQDLGQAVSCLGKTEDWLMLRFEDGCRMAFAGSERDPMCFVGVSMYGACTDAQMEEMTAAVTRILEKRLSISPERIYVRYNPCDTWGWSGHNF